MEFLVLSFLTNSFITRLAAAPLSSRALTTTGFWLSVLSVKLHESNWFHVNGFLQLVGI